MRPPYFFPMDVFFTFFRMDTLYCVHRMLRGEKGSDPQHLRCLAAKNVQGGRERWAKGIKRIEVNEDFFMSCVKFSG